VSSPVKQALLGWRAPNKNLDPYHHKGPYMVYYQTYVIPKMKGRIALKSLASEGIRVKVAKVQRGGTDTRKNAKEFGSNLLICVLQFPPIVTPHII